MTTQEKPSMDVSTVPINERTIIASIAEKPQWLSDFDEIGLTSNMFSDVHTARMFVEIVKAVENGDPTDILTIANAAQIPPELTESIIYTPSIDFPNARKLAQNIVDSHKRKAMASIMGDLRARILEKNLEDPGAIRMEAIERLEAIETGRRGRKRRTMRNLPVAPNENENPNALFKRGWLRKGGSALLIAPAGVGKSVFSIQAAILWAMGKPAFGLDPVRKLKITIIQTEDDDVDMAEFKEGIINGLISEGLTLEEINEGCDNIILENGTGVMGEDFARLIGTVAREKSDLVIANPFNAFSGIDTSKNDQLTHFVRGQLDPRLKNERNPIGIVFMHHITKIKDGEPWDKSIYAGQGGAELANWVRAGLSLSKVEKSNVFKLTATKRSSRTGWTDNTGNPTDIKFIAHSNDYVYWRVPTPEEVNEAMAMKSEASKSKKNKEKSIITPQDNTATLKDAAVLANEIRKRGKMTLKEAQSHAEIIAPPNHDSARPFDRKNAIYSEVKNNAGAYKLVVTKKQKGVNYIGTAEAIAKMTDGDNKNVIPPLTEDNNNGDMP